MAKKIRLALSGSGYLAPVHGGAVCALLDAGIEIIEVAGTSGGSIVAAMLASGMDAGQIKIAALSDLPEGIVEYHALELFSEGLNSGGILHDWLEYILGDATFAEAKIPVQIMATDINAGRGHCFDATSAPALTLADACRASASVPLVYVPFTVNGVKYCDGGMSNNIPVDVLVDDQYPRVGFEVMDGTESGNTDSMAGLMEQCIKTMMQSNEDNLTAWAQHTGSLISQIDANPFNFLDASLPLSAKQELFQRGYQAAQSIIGKLP